MPAIRMIYNNEKGMVLPLGLMFLAIIAILGTTAVIITTTDIKIGSNYKTSVQAFYNAEAGLARAEAELINDLNTDNDLSNTSFEAISGTIAIAPSSTDFYTPAGFNNIPFGAGDYTIQFKNYAPDPTAPNVYHPAIIWVRSIGTAPNSSTVTLESYLSAENISPWNNAIFAGGGGGSAVPITGNVIIAGSVHILGEGLPATTTVFNNQTGDCRNNSTSVPPVLGMDGTLASKVDGGASSDLNAKFRVKNGLVDMSLGVGDIGTLPNPFKGIYVTDGDDVGGDGVNDDIILGGAASIYADKGATSAKAYDLGDYNITLPSIDTALLDANSLDLTGTTEVDGWGTGLNAGALELTGKHKEGPTWYYPHINRADASNSINFDSITNILTINGIIKVLSLNISDNITYVGRGTIYTTTGTAAISGHVLPDTATSYPTTNVFGVVSTGNIAMGGGAQILLTGAYYSAGKIETDMQTELAGTIVCKNFDITNQTPKIWQVPSLATNLPPGMPGSTPIWVFTDRTWREMIK